MALTAQRHVHVISTNHEVAVLACGAESKAGVLLAELADSSQLLDFLALRNQLYYAWERTAHEGSLQT